MIDRSFIGVSSEARRAVAEAGQIKLFCKAIGEENPIFLSGKAARAAGYRGQVAPPTFVFSMNLLSTDDQFAEVVKLGVNPNHILHGEQEFVYHDYVCAGDELVFVDTWTNFEEKKGGKLVLLHSTTKATRPDGAPVADLNVVAVVRNP